MTGQATARARGEPDLGQALMDVAEAIADMARRVQLNGPEKVYLRLGEARPRAVQDGRRTRAVRRRDRRGDGGGVPGPRARACG